MAKKKIRSAKESKVNLDAFELVEIETLKPDPRNPRRGDIDEIAASMDQFGQDQACVVRRSNRQIIKGNHRYFAAKDKLGWKRILVYWVSDDEATAIQRGLADNRIGDLATFDEEELASIMADLERQVGDLQVPGFDEDYMDQLREMIAGLGEEDAPPATKNSDDGKTPGMGTGLGDNDEAPGSFEDVGEDINTSYRCPSCNYEWSGRPR